MIWEGLNGPYSTVVADPPWPYQARFMGPRTRGGQGAYPMPYSTMTVGAIAQLRVAELTAPGGHLYLWATQRFLWDAKEILEGWGFDALKVLTWCKTPVGHGPGGSFANTTEFILFGRRRVASLIRDAREQEGISQNAVDLRVRGRVTRMAKRWEDGDCYPSSEDWDGLREALPALASMPPIVEESALSPTTWFQWPRGPHSAKPPASYDLVEQVSPGPYVELFARQPRLGWDSWGFGYEEQAL